MLSAYNANKKRYVNDLLEFEHEVFENGYEWRISPATDSYTSLVEKTSNKKLINPFRVSRKNEKKKDRLAPAFKVFVDLEYGDMSAYQEFASKYGPLGPIYGDDEIAQDKYCLTEAYRFLHFWQIEHDDMKKCHAIFFALKNKEKIPMTGYIANFAIIPFRNSYADIHKNDDYPEIHDDVFNNPDSYKYNDQKEEKRRSKDWHPPDLKELIKKIEAKKPSDYLELPKIDVSVYKSKGEDSYYDIPEDSARFSIPIIDDNNIYKIYDLIVKNKWSLVLQPSGEFSMRKFLITHEDLRDVAIPSVSLFARIWLSKFLDWNSLFNRCNYSNHFDPVSQKWVPTIKPETLIAGMWYQLTEFFAGKRQYRECSCCRDWEDITDNRSNWDKHIDCARKARTNRYRRKKKEK